MGIVPLEGNGEGSSVVGQTGDSSIVAEGKFRPMLRRNVLHQGEKLADNGAVAEHGDGLVGVLVGDGTQSRVETGGGHLEGLAPGSLPGGICAAKESHLLGAVVAGVAKGAVFPAAEMQLPQTGMGVQL